MVDRSGRLSVKSLFSVFVLVLLLLLCGKGHAAEPVKVGLATSLSGKYETFGTEQSRGVKMWVEDMNERGALLGRPVELIIYDNESDRETCARLYEKLITEDKVDLLIGPYSSGMTLAARPVVEKHNFPLMVEGTAPSIWERGVKNMFGFLTQLILDNPQPFGIFTDQFGNFLISQRVHSLLDIAYGWFDQCR